jgi:MFS family permease
MQANKNLPVIVTSAPMAAEGLSSSRRWLTLGVLCAGLVLVAGSRADRIGRKRTLLAGLVIFAAGSAWAAFSGSAGTLIAARAGMGIGGALMMPSTLSIVATCSATPAGGSGQ